MNISESGMNIASSLGNSYENYSQPNSQASSLKEQQQDIEAQKEKQDTEDQKRQLNELAQKLNKELSPLNTSVTFDFNEDIEGLYITVSERDTNRVIRKIPSDEAMELMAKMKEVVGMIFDKNV
ncbi:flagellar biosynthesis protein FlaG [Helicobacter valdiviensis]|uniref:Flagellar biosynthesis protein FlaG n=1 Tax=Helicobacter valdiviensis TaxID=1458358 RepID=A0A2W6MW67_9HELI|nr:FlaG family protein [Helicobacter valdiviensis]PZT48755.1 flagellar biosynthesis protein FlaG [Helicobacter valdiviensis]